MRVPAEKLDALLTHSGELLVARRRVGSRGDDLEAIRDFLGRWRAEWRAVEKPLSALLGRPDTPRRAAPAPGRARRSGRAGENLGRLERDLERLASAMTADRSQLDRAASLLDDEVRRVRMLPFAEACQGLDRAVRDVAQAVGKQVDLVVEGGDVELDRSVLEGLKDPLRHLVRNAVDHGIEPPEQRRAAGQACRWRGSRSPRPSGGRRSRWSSPTTGGGLDLDRLREQARRAGSPSRPTTATWSG